MTIDITVPTPDDWAEILAIDTRNFGSGPLTEAQAEAASRWLPLDRCLVARSRSASDKGRIVGMAGSVPLELTLPGLTLLPLAGATWVSVNPTHTRQGVLGRLMSGIHEMAAARGEPLVGLQASEGAIYARYGYGVSTNARVVSIDRRRARLREGLGADRSRVVQYSQAERVERRDREFELYDRYRRQQVGEVNRDRTILAFGHTFASASTVLAEHPDGYAVYDITVNWAEGHPAHSLQLLALVAATPQARLDLWDLLLNIDLVGPIHSRNAVGLDDPLPHLLTDPRVVRTRELNDFTWLKVLDMAAAFGARTYRIADSVTLAVAQTGEAVTITQSAAPTATATATVTDDEPDLIVDEGALGPLLLGTVTPSQLAVFGTLRGETASLGRFDAFFGHAPRAHGQAHF